MPSNTRRIAVHLAAAMTLAAAVALAESFSAAMPDSPPGGGQVRRPDLPTTFTTPGNVKAKVVSSTPRRLRIDATAPSGTTTTVTIVGPPTVMQKGAIETFIDIAIAVLDKIITEVGQGKCTQTITTTVTGGVSTTTIKTECTAPR